MRKSLLMTTLFAVVVMASMAFTADDPLYKNLKVLPKNTTKPQMDSVMRHFTAALGVKCNFCHQFNAEAKTMDWASDANKHKLVARNMMKMTNKINKKYFDVAGGRKNLDATLMVSCFTCHNGKAEPVVQAPRAENAAGGPPPRPGADTTRRQQ